jgi:uncharacterized protein YceK
MKTHKLLSLLIAVLLLSGCATFGTRSRTADVLAATEARQLALACLVWANEHNGALPPDLAALKNHVTVTRVDAFELCASGQLAAIKDPATTILLREKRTARCGCRATAYADGHCELLPAPKP